MLQELDATRGRVEREGGELIALAQAEPDLVPTCGGHGALFGFVDSLSVFLGC